tara:strand:+ start:14 stop:409 length:396 start_codon:yes stop_codon:yes gene_type:complete
MFQEFSSVYVFTNLPRELQLSITTYIINPFLEYRHYRQSVMRKGVIELLGKKATTRKLQSPTNELALYYYIADKIRNIRHEESIETILLTFTKDKYRIVRQLPTPPYFTELILLFEQKIFINYNPFDGRGY